MEEMDRDEDWKIIDGYINYEISVDGRVRNVQTRRILKPCISSGKYLVGLSKKGRAKSSFIHTLVASAFVENPNNLTDIYHINRNSLDNRAINLKYVTRTESCMKAKKRNNTNSRYKGVCYDKDKNKWAARIMIHGKRVRLGRFANEQDAANAYNKRALEIYGELAVINQIPDEQ